MNQHPRHNAAFLLFPIILMLIAFFSAPVVDAQAHLLAYTVNTVVDHDDGACNLTDCTLREAILAANAHPNDASPDEIHFNITSGCNAVTGVCSFALATLLPAVTEAVIIDGFSQPGASANTLEVGSNARLLIELNGANGPFASDGLTITGSGSTVRGLVVNRWKRSAIYIKGSAAAGNIVQGNYLGTDAAGSVVLRNVNGVAIENAPNNIVGGTAPQARNLLSGNSYGVSITGSGATGNIVRGNYVGTDASGRSVLSNTLAGIHSSEAANNVFGGVGPGAGNVISGNARGIYFWKTSGNTIQGNFIGTDVTGTAMLGNTFEGIYLNQSASNLIGGIDPGARNLISGNGNYGINMVGSSASNNILQGNRIGTDITGSLDFGNGFGGIYVDNAPNATIGGTAPGAGNLISGNNGEGIDIYGSGATGAIIQGNRIGTDSTGTEKIGNSGTGICIIYSSGALIGGTAPGARNLLSGNGSSGVCITGGAPGNQVQGNFIGTDITGTVDLSNKGLAVYIIGSPNNIVGGGAPGAGNLIVSNSFGIEILYPASTGNIVQGNSVGSDITGTRKLGNTISNISVTNASGNLIGGTAPGEGNRLAGGYYGMTLLNSGAPGNTVQGNRIGVDVTGTIPLGSRSNGLMISSSSYNTIGGAVAGAGNLISGSGGVGIYIESTANGGDSTGNTVQGNYIGTDKNGKASLANASNGVVLNNVSKNRIGGADAGEGNIISGNHGSGILITGSSASGNTILGNNIGTDADGTARLGNSGGGIWIQYAPNNTIGDITAGAGNLISGNLAGVTIQGSSAKGNRVLGNAIFDNAFLGIDFDGNAVTYNDAGDGDSGPNELQNFPVLTWLSTGALSGTLNSAANTTFRVEFFANSACDPTGYGEGEQFLGALDSVITDGSGNATFTFQYTPVTGKPYLTATATNMATGDTSEFSPCLPYRTRTFLSVTPTASTFCDAITLTAMVNTEITERFFPTGQVQFKDGDSPLGPPVSLGDSGEAVYTTSALAFGEHTLVAEFLANDTYLGSSSSLAFTVSPPIMLTATEITASDKVYDGTTVATLDTSAAVLNGVVGDESVILNTASATGAFADKNAAPGKTVTISGLTISGADACHYILVQPSTSASILPRPLTLTAENQNKVYGAPLPVLTVGYSGFAEGESPSVLTSPPEVITTADASSPVGQYPITITSGSPSALNYTFTLKDGVLTIDKARTSLTLSVSSADALFGKPVTLTAVVSIEPPGAGDVLGLVTFMDGETSLGSAPLTVSSAGEVKATFTTSALAAGPHTFSAAFDGDTNFSGSIDFFTVEWRSIVFLPMVGR